MTQLGTPTGFVRRLVAAILVMAATSAVLVGVSAPATAAACSSSSGVSVIVDFTGVASGIESACVADGGDRPASDVITSAGFAITYVQRQPGFLCRLDGVPASDPCVNTPPADAYWGLFWSDGKDGVWHYSDFGVTGLQVPDGGYIGLAWQSGTRRVPGQAATAHAVEEASPTSTPSSIPSSTASATPTTTGPSPTQAPPSGTTSPTRSPKPAGTASPGPTGPTGPTGTASGSPALTPGTAAGTTPAAPSGSASPSTAGSETPTEQSTAAGSRTPSPGAKTSSAAAEPVETDAASSAPSSTSTDAVADPVAPSAAATESRRVPTWVSMGILVLLLVSIGISSVAARRRTRP